MLPAGQKYLKYCPLHVFNQCLLFSKLLIRSTEKERLHAVNDAEVERLVERWTSDECFNAIMSFFQNKSKLWKSLHFQTNKKVMY